MSMRNGRNLSDVTLTDVMRMYGVTARAVRYYEAVGLIETARDRRNCRTYDARARERLRLIVELRKAGVAIEDIREVLDADYDRDAMAAAVEKLSLRIARLEAEREVAAQVMRRFDDALQAPERPQVGRGGQAPLRAAATA
ncbi:MAG: MerR family transcriptional regulator [Phenylobacterium sp.]|jgi:DNA-binding transcriptional MerR regulator|uniref:MerR family transcriptional regulator n=1 Tax=Phenylobacterium sp. TaxID=1871053 RepID=UPI003918928D